MFLSGGPFFAVQTWGVHQNATRGGESANLTSSYPFAPRPEWCHRAAASYKAMKEYANCAKGLTIVPPANSCLGGVDLHTSSRARSCTHHSHTSSCIRAGFLLLDSVPLELFITCEHRTDHQVEMLQLPTRGRLPEPSRVLREVLQVQRTSVG